MKFFTPKKANIFAPENTPGPQKERLVFQPPIVSGRVCGRCVFVFQQSHTFLREDSGLILLMAEIPHHLTCRNPANNEININSIHDVFGAESCFFRTQKRLRTSDNNSEQLKGSAGGVFFFHLSRYYIKTATSPGCVGL